MLNSNILLFRRFAKYEIEVPATLKYMDNGRIAYWEAIQTEEEKNVILLHGFTRNSGRMNSRANIYWKRGYNIYFIDNRGHGKSKSILFPSGFQYSFIVRKFIKEMNIKNPILHGASMGGIASAYVAQKEPGVVKFIICEALPYDFDNLYPDMMEFMKIPIALFPWMDWLSRKIVWRQFKGEDAEYNLTDINCPMFVINGAKDLMFKPEFHFDKIVNELGDRDNFSSWLVPNSRHTRMDGHPEYKEKLVEFIQSFE